MMHESLGAGRMTMAMPQILHVLTVNGGPAERPGFYEMHVRVSAGPGQPQQDLTLVFENARARSLQGFLLDNPPIDAKD